MICVLYFKDFYFYFYSPSETIVFLPTIYEYSYIFIMNQEVRGDWWLDVGGGGEVI